MNGKTQSTQQFNLLDQLLYAGLYRLILREAAGSDRSVDSGAVSDRLLARDEDVGHAFVLAHEHEVQDDFEGSTVCGENDQGRLSVIHLLRYLVCAADQAINSPGLLYHVVDLAG